MLRLGYLPTLIQAGAELLITKPVSLAMYRVAATNLVDQTTSIKIRGYMIPMLESKLAEVNWL
jgi:hypothetical protein